MSSANHYSGIDARIVASVRHHARRASGKVPGLELEDLEQELMLHAHRRLNSYDPARADLWTFVDRVLSNFLANLATAARAKSRGGGTFTISLDDPNLERDSEEIAAAADNGGSREPSWCEYIRRPWWSRLAVTGPTRRLARSRKSFTCIGVARSPAVPPPSMLSSSGARALACTFVAGDATAITPAHPLRWPGSWHRKAEPRLARIIDLSPDVELEPSEVVELLEPLIPVQRGGGRRRGNSPHDSMLDDHDLAALGEIIANSDREWADWNRMGMAFFAASNGSEAGLAAFDRVDDIELAHWWGFQAAAGAVLALQGDRRDHRGAAQHHRHHARGMKQALRVGVVM